jgi:3-oxoacyl-[acyl-carrier-protein] synthase II
MMEFSILGGGWVTASGFGQMSSGINLHVETGEPMIPKAKDIFSQPMLRYGRFDRYTKLGVAAIALALRDAGLDHFTEKQPVGIVLSSRYECLESDIEYYKTTRDEDGSLSSPNLFSYTLPGIVIGESAIHFKLSGPTFTMGEDESKGLGMAALNAAATLINSGVCRTMVAGWLDYPPELPANVTRSNVQKGAVFVVLSSGNNGRRLVNVSDQNQLLINNREISQITELFNADY